MELIAASINIRRQFELLHEIDGQQTLTIETVLNMHA